jgi:hypothetical protein
MSTYQFDTHKKRIGKMNLLPSERNNRIEQAIKDFEETGRLVISEPCNCGSHIRHNNGGNYHQIIHLARDGDKVFVAFDSTCELVPSAEWEPCEDYRALITDYGDWL